ncbi:hypothetical protein KUH32_10880 [Thalassococcus sp. CAU 1522]|uniref:Uncharacterized protein n=1 Tax=Thalassococcus arenae TaxID=2851652 RepID=A0ABS6N8E3_9RHOB|nr:hypothetical protein [Thalassococcus arenae]MBV2360281.1 hypothetical protein [Thalassococcus arenae]
MRANPALRWLVVAAMLAVGVVASAATYVLTSRYVISELERDPGAVDRAFALLSWRRGGADQPPDFAVRTHDDKRRLARRIDALYPAPGDGWTRRPFEAADFWRLRPDLAHCDGRHDRPSMVEYFQGPGDGCPMKPGEAGAVVYERGSALIVLSAKFSRDGARSGPRYSSGGLPTVMRFSFGDDYYDTEYPDFLRHRGLRFGRLPNNDPTRRGPVQNLPLRVYGVGRDDGVLRVFVAARAPQGEVKRLLMRMDARMIDALLAPPGAARLQRHD